MDFFTPVVAPFKLNPGFVKISCTRNRYALDVIQDWARGIQDRDGKFVKEFQTSFQPSFRELYLCSTLNNFNICIDFQHSRPDFVVTDPEAFTIEATVALNDSRTGSSHSPSSSENPEELNLFNEEAIVKLGNSFSAKRAKFRRSYSSLPQVTRKAFVHAIEPFDRPFAHLAAQRTVESLLFGYYVDEEAYLKEGELSERSRGHKIKQVVKHNGAPVDVGLFNGHSVKEISAVIFNSTATWGKALALSKDPQSNYVFTAVSLKNGGVLADMYTMPKSSYTEHLIDGIRINHNPYATHSLAADIFRNRRVYQFFWDDSAQNWVYKQHDGQLLFRSVSTVIEKC
ncbi:glycosaminoglycan attachment site [Marinobacterium rhizophilum]|uniref:glycosaminoglycan attachment site n=1 Tax=Marinobacterium rhizophilum TaxID=420402 RepID=UPI0012EC707A|nr:glycosaminoglycan attachment site [Marinobacterium rhizophilum]